MAFYSHTAAGTRTVLQKGDITDAITRLDVKHHPLFKFIPKRKATDIYVQGLEDTLAAPGANAHAQGAAAPDPVDHARTLNGNYTQLFLKTASVANSHQAVAQYGMPQGELPYQEAIKTIEIMQEIERYLVSNQILQAPTPLNGRIGLMSGISTIIASHTWPCSDFSQTSWMTLMEGVLRDGGNPTRAWCDGVRKAAISGWVTNVQRVSADVRALDTEINVYHGWLGPSVAIEWHPYMPADITGNGGAACLFCIQPDLWKIPELIKLNRTYLGVQGSSRQTMLEWEGTIHCRAEKGNFEYIEGLGTTTTGGN